MASGAPVQDLREEATCSICLEFFRDPVMITECGHNFCRACLARCWGEEADTDTFCCCPQCRQKVQQSCLRPNRQLANVVEIAKKLSLQVGRGAEEKGGVCEKHQEPLKLFCQKDQILICVVCDRSKEHRNHEVIPLEEASQEYKDQICSCLETLKREREDLLSFKSEIEKESQDLLKQTEAEKQKTVAAFRQLREFLEEQETCLLAQVDEVEAEVAREREEHLAGLSKELSSLDKVIQEMEEKLQLPSSELLWGVGSTLQRYEKKVTVEAPVAFPPALKWKIWDIRDLNPFLDVIMKQFRDTLESGLQWQKASVTLDQDTAHPELILSQDQKSVRCRQDLPDNPERFGAFPFMLGLEGGKGREIGAPKGLIRRMDKEERQYHFFDLPPSRDRKSVRREAKHQDLPDNPERFNRHPFVLGCEGFTAARHFWEVTVGNEGRWAVGVARKSVGRKEWGIDCPERGIWAMEKREGKYRLSSLPPVSLTREPKRVRVSLNCPGGRLAFFDADTAALILSYTEASFSGETLLPLFSVDRKASLTLSP